MCVKMYYFNTNYVIKKQPHLMNLFLWLNRLVSK